MMSFRDYLNFYYYTFNVSGVSESKIGILRNHNLKVEIDDKVVMYLSDLVNKYHEKFLKKTNYDISEYKKEHLEFLDYEFQFGLNTSVYYFDSKNSRFVWSLKFLSPEFGAEKRFDSILRLDPNYSGPDIQIVDVEKCKTFQPLPKNDVIEDSWCYAGCGRMVKIVNKTPRLCDICGKQDDERL